MEAVPPQRAPLKRPLPSRRYSRPLRLTVPPGREQRTEKEVTRVGVRERRRRRKKKEKKGKRKKKENIKNELSIF
jgi:hypothetical protein